MFHIANELNKMQDFLNSWLVEASALSSNNVWSQFFNYEGKEYLYELHLMPAIDTFKKEVIGSCIAVMDITDDALNTGGAKFRETHDSLTGIYNEEGFNKSIRTILTNNPNEKYYIICSNIKRFKLLNQLFGMEKGDEVLRHIASGLEKWCKAGDVYGRTHSDEFVLLMKTLYTHFLKKSMDFYKLIISLSSFLASIVYIMPFSIVDKVFLIHHIFWIYFLVVNIGHTIQNLVLLHL